MTLLPLLLLASQAADPAPVVQAPAQATEAPSIVEVEEGPGGRLGIRSVALYRLNADGIEPRVAEAVTRSLVQELRKREGLLVVDLGDLKAALDAEAERQALGCDDEDTSCLSEVSDALGVDELLIGAITDVGDQRMFALRRLDQRKAKSIASANRALVPARGEALLAALGPIVEELYADFSLREGETAGVAPEVALRLNPPPISTTLTWSTFIAGGALAALASGAGLYAALELQTAAKVAQGSTDSEVPASFATEPYNNAVAAGYLAQGLGVAAGVLLLTGAVMLPFTNFATE